MARSFHAAVIALLFLLHSSCADKFEWNRSSSGSTAKPSKNLAGLVSTPFPFPAHFGGVRDIAVIGSGSHPTLFILDGGNQLIRRSNGTTVLTLAGTSGSAGSTDGTGTVALFDDLQSLAANSDGDFYLSDGHAIRKLTPSGMVTTLAGIVQTPGNVDDLGSTARFRNVRGLTVGEFDYLYVVDGGNHQIRRVTPIGNVTTLAGTGSAGSADGNGTGASFDSPSDIVRDSNGDFFITDTGNHTIRKMTSTGDVTVFAGQTGVNDLIDGNGIAAAFEGPTGLAIDADDNLYTGNGAIRKITPAGDVTTLAGGVITGRTEDGTGAAAAFFDPTGITIDAEGNLFVADETTIRKITPTGTVTTVAGEDSYWGDNDGVTGGVSIPLSRGITRNIDGNFYIVQADH
ncbi:MAG TPA: hypothetical protein PL182_08700, partial [Pseudobdellovibrionaceae bacterium]|nr:hypothetical protein [Pseudobdellovibrionaceae bacterium]